MVQELLRGAYITTQDTDVDYEVAAYFDIIQEHSISLQSQITDNWLENNTAIADHIANQPLVISLRGLTGELVYESPYVATFNSYAAVNGFIQNKTINSKLLQAKNIGNAFSVNPYLKTDKLIALSSLYPPVDNVTQAAKNLVNYAESSVKRYIKLFDNLRSSAQNQSRLEKIYKNLALLRAAKTGLIVHTPYKTFNDMYIQSLTLRQNNQNYITDIEISLKQVYFSDSQITTPNQQNRSKCNFLQRDEVENHGATQGISGNLGDSDEGGGFENLFKASVTYEKEI